MNPADSRNNSGRRQPEVSVLIPTYNRAARLTAALESALCQTCRDFEVIVVDDCSRDDTRKVVEAVDYPDLRYIRHHRNLGPSAARNTGILAAAGEYIAFLDDDDRWFPRKLQEQVNAIRNSPLRVGVVSCSYNIVSDMNGMVVREDLSCNHPDTPLGFLRSTGFMTSIPLIRKRCFETEGLFDVGLPGCQDKDMWIRIAGRYSFARVPEILAEHRVHGSQISAKLEIKTRAKQMILAKHRDILDRNPKVLSMYLEKIGLLYCAAGNVEEGRRYFLHSLRHTPGSESAMLHLKLSRSDPKAHRKHIIGDVLPSVDGVTLYY